MDEGTVNAIIFAVIMLAIIILCAAAACADQLPVLISEQLITNHMDLPGWEML